MKEKVKELREAVRQAYDLTDGVPASGEGLDRLAAARQGMRNAYRLTGDLLQVLDASANAGEGNHG